MGFSTTNHRFGGTPMTMETHHLENPPSPAALPWRLPAGEAEAAAKGSAAVGCGVQNADSRGGVSQIWGVDP